MNQIFKSLVKVEQPETILTQKLFKFNEKDFSLKDIIDETDLKQKVFETIGCSDEEDKFKYVSFKIKEINQKGILSQIS